MPLNRKRGAAVALGATLALALLMFLPRFFSFGIGLGCALLVVIIIGLLDFFGAWQVGVPSTAVNSPPKPIDLSTAPTWIRLLSHFNLRILYLGLSLFVAGACRLSVLDTLGAAAPWSGPLLFGLGALAIVIARFWRRPFDGRLHEGFLVLGVATAMIFSTLGSHGLWDCWETHYGEVARRQLEQDDWISLFWENKWFYSKPILIFWLMNLGMALFAVRVGPDQIPDHAEWGVRFLVGALAVAVLYAVFELMRRRVSRRAALFTVVVLGTTPLFNFMARQAITDMPFVGFMTIAVVLFLLGATAAPEAKVASLVIPLGRNRRIHLSAFHGLIAAYTMVALPQYLYLATRSAKFIFGTLGREDLRFVLSQGRLTNVHLSDFVPSLFGHTLRGSFDLSLDWLLLGLAFIVPFLALLHSLRDERRVRPLCMFGMYLCLALSVMAKGLPGLAMPVLGLVGYWFIIAPFKDLKRPKIFVRWHTERIMKLEPLRGIPLLLLVSSPWYVAMTVRHGYAFINRFFIHDHIKRISVGVHGDTGTVQYFIEQLSYAAFPWIALLPFAFFYGVRALRRTGDPAVESPADRSRRTVRLFITAWSFASFALLSMMATKFHHYVLPLLPPVTMLIGLFLDDLWKTKLRLARVITLTAIAIVVIIALELIGQPDKPKGVLDGYAQLVGLFIYKYSRPYPAGEAFDFSLPLIVFSALFICTMATWFVSRWRKVGIALTVLVALAFAHWTAQHYMVQLAPHWTQKHLIQEYYQRRTSPSERLVAFQMNWKGENFYTGNRVVVFVSTKNKKYEEWLDQHRGERHFFITEFRRFKRMSNRAQAKSGPLEPLVTHCNKYRAGLADEL